MIFYRLIQSFDFYFLQIDSKNVGIFIIHKAVGQPVKFQKNAYIRIGSYTKNLKDYHSTEAQLEEQYIQQDLELEQALNSLNYSSYFELQGEAYT